MEKEIAFAKALQGLKELAKEQGNIVSKEQVGTAFPEMNLDANQLEMIYDYLKSNKIGVDEQVSLDDYLTSEEKDYLEFYLEEINALEEVTSGEKEAIELSAMAGDETAKAKLIEIYLPKVVEIAKLYAGQGVFLEDLIGEGNIALTMGVSMLGCLEHAKEVEGMLGKMMMDAMEAYITENVENKESDAKIVERVNEVADKVAELSELLQRKVTIEEIEKETGFSREEIEEVIRISGGKFENVQGEEDASW